MYLPLSLYIYIYIYMFIYLLAYMRSSPSRRGLNCVMTRFLACRPARGGSLGIHVHVIFA